MKKIAVFGNTGAGKSTLAKSISDITGLPLYSIDKLKFKIGGDEIPHDIYLKQHAKLINHEQWVIDGFGCVPSAWERFAKADTLVFIDLPIYVHAFWVIKRMFKGLLVTPEGWPVGSPILKSTLKSFHVLWLCHSKLTPRYRKLIEEDDARTVFHLKSKGEIRAFVEKLKASN